jgi:hypothetical protein
VVSVCGVCLSVCVRMVYVVCVHVCVMFVFGYNICAVCV